MTQSALPSFSIQAVLVSVINVEAVKGNVEAVMGNVEAVRSNFVENKGFLSLR